MRQGVDLKKKVWQTFHQLPQEKQKQPIFLAVSGGMDSTVLASVALELREKLPPLHFVHVNYHLRRPDSDREERSLATWAEKKDITFHVKRFYPKKKPSNLQAWARERRLTFFAHLIEKIGKGKGTIWLAHHQQDQAETVLERLLRGAGLKGLGGMESFETLTSISNIGLSHPLYLFRPFLEVPHEAITRYAHFHHVKFHQDSSNLSSLYLRNRIRHQILPQLMKENPKIIETLMALGQKTRDAHMALEALAKVWCAKHLRKLKKKSWIPLQPLSALPEGLITCICEQFISTTTLQRQAFSKVLPRILHYVRLPQARLRIPLKGGFELTLQETSLSLLHN